VAGSEDEAATALIQRLSRAAGDAARIAERRSGLESRIEEAEQRIRQSRFNRQLAEQHLAPYLAAAGIAVEDTGADPDADPDRGDDAEDRCRAEARDALAQAITRWHAARQKLAQETALVDEILQQGDGLTLDDLMGLCQDADAIALKIRTDQLQEEIEGLTRRIEDLAARQATAEAAAADMEQAKAAMEIEAEAYIGKRTEATLLRWAIDRYRSEKQAPLLRRASELFAMLTLGRYTALTVDYEQDKPRLLAISADGSAAVPVTGMSEGTVDQLYLALRVAAIEDTVRGGMPLPFLADDLFVNYDDERAGAGFRVLAELARSTQVLFFTHHAHLLNIARQALGPVEISISHLG
jgi:uncharacterized protein YhaN